MLSNLKIGKRLTMGFAVVLLMAIVLGLLAVSRMWTVREAVIDLNEHNMGSLRVLNEFERHTMLARYAMRMFAETHNQAFLTEGRGHVADMTTAVKQCAALAKEHDLVALHDAAAKAQEALDQYKGLIDQTAEIVGQMDVIRGKMNPAGETLAEECDKYFESQITKATEEANQNTGAAKMAERLHKLKVSQDMLVWSGQIRLGNMKMQAWKDAKYIDAALPNFEKIAVAIDELVKITMQDVNKKQLDTVRQTTLAYQGLVTDYIKLDGALQKCNSQRATHADMMMAMAKQHAIGSLDEAAHATAGAATMLSSAQMTMSIGLGIMVAAGMVIAWLITRGITRPLTSMVGFLNTIAQGDISHDVPVELSARKDEIGILGNAAGAMAANLKKMLQDVTNGVQTLASSSTELSAVSTQMSSNASQTAGKSASVATAAEEMSANTTSVAAGMEQASTNLASVATATEEMTATIGEIATNSEKARSITADATQQTAKASGLIKELGHAAREIGKVTETITSISSQTNLLALNATIEAARAGSAGKGFAVVANEIKELAQQTATATEDIKSKITAIQNSTAGTVQDIEKINDVIKQVGDIVATIASAIEEQSTVTKDIAGNIAEASTGVKDANQRVAQTASVSQGIAREIAGVNQASGEMTTGSTQVQTSAGELSKLAEQLKGMVGRFKV